MTSIWFPRAFLAFIIAPDPAVEGRSDHESRMSVMLAGGLYHDPAYRLSERGRTRLSDFVFIAAGQTEAVWRTESMEVTEPHKFAISSELKRMPSFQQADRRLWLPCFLYWPAPRYLPASLPFARPAVGLACPCPAMLLHAPVPTISHGYPAGGHFIIRSGAYTERQMSHPGRCHHRTAAGKGRTESGRCTHLCCARCGGLRTVA